ncbi:MAG: NYN domain-containing protein [Aggregatilineales bacterium]
MAAYLIVDVDDLIRRFQSRDMSVDLQELAVGLRGGAALAAGLPNVSMLKAVAFANWSDIGHPSKAALQAFMRRNGYEIFDLPVREDVADALFIHYFSYDPDPIDELILATTNRDLLPLVKRIRITRNARIRVWGSEDVLKGTEFADDVIFQPLETLLGIKPTTNVLVYVDFENIAISLTENGYILNLEQLIERFVKQAQAHGHVVKMAAYGPWGQRGTLPPMMDNNGREITDEAPTRLMMANIDPVFNLPGKNSADIRIARDVLTDVGHSDTSGDIFILASGDRDFNEVVNRVIQRGKEVIIWGVRGAVSRQLVNHPAVHVEYIEDFMELQTPASFLNAPVVDDPATEFLPSQWSSVVIQFDRTARRLNTDQLRAQDLYARLIEVGAAINVERAEELVKQAINMNILRPAMPGVLTLNAVHPVVEKTRVIAEAISRRVANTLKVRGWQYVNYGFLLKGLEMERDIMRPGMNTDDQWRSQWIDALVRERVLARELVPHRHNPDDLVPVISLAEVNANRDDLADTNVEYRPINVPEITNWEGMTPLEFASYDKHAYEMAMRVIVSVEQFTSFRKFAWCPLGSLHRRLRPFDINMAFQRSVEYLSANHIVTVQEYPNPQSNYNTKGISVNMESEYAQSVLAQRDEFVRLLITLYERNVPISVQTIQDADPDKLWDIQLWISIMETENVLNDLPGRAGQYSLFRTHHTVKLVAGDPM